MAIQYDTDELRLRQGRITPALAADIAYGPTPTVGMGEIFSEDRDQRLDEYATRIRESLQAAREARLMEAARIAEAGRYLTFAWNEFSGNRDAFDTWVRDALQLDIKPATVDNYRNFARWWAAAAHHDREAVLRHVNWSAVYTIAANTTDEELALRTDLLALMAEAGVRVTAHDARALEAAPAYLTDALRSRRATAADVRLIALLLHNLPPEAHEVNTVIERNQIVEAAVAQGIFHAYERREATRQSPRPSRTFDDMAQNNVADFGDQPVDDQGTTVVPLSQMTGALMERHKQVRQQFAQYERALEDDQIIFNATLTPERAAALSALYSTPDQPVDFTPHVGKRVRTVTYIPQTKGGA